MGHELIEALSKFNLLMVLPLSPSSRHESSLNCEATVVHLKENQSSYRERKVKSSLENQASDPRFVDKEMERC
jgi:hypothetical protein